MAAASGFFIVYSELKELQSRAKSTGTRIRDVNNNRVAIIMDEGLVQFIMETPEITEVLLRNNSTLKENNNK